MRLFDDLTMPFRQCSALTLLLLLPACPNGPSAPPPGACEDAALTPPSATLGTGGSEFTDLPDGADLEVQVGFQGGFHVWGSVRTTGLYPGNQADYRDHANPLVRFQVALPDGTIVADTGDQRRPLNPNSTGEFDLVGQVVRLPNDSVSALANQQVSLSVSITDGCATTVMDSRNVRLIENF